MPLKIVRRGDIWQVTGTVGGKRIRESTGTSNESVAAAIKARREWELEQGSVFGPKATLTFGAAVCKYLEGGGSERFLMPIFERWEERLVSGIRPGDIRQLARELYPDCTIETWNRQVIVPARAVINHCADLGLCEFIRVKGFSKQERKRQHARIGKRDHQPVAVGWAWIDAFIANAPPHLGALCLFMFTTAARISEATRLTWEHVDMESRVAWLVNAKEGDGEALLSGEMVVALANLERRGEKVFGYASRHHVYDPWKAVCEKAGIRYIPPHQAGRHSFATELLVRRGMDIDTAKRLGRWKSGSLLTDTYVHGRADHDAVEDIFGRKSGTRKS